MSVCRVLLLDGTDFEVTVDVSSDVVWASLYISWLQKSVFGYFIKTKTNSNTSVNTTLSLTAAKVTLQVGKNK